MKRILILLSVLPLLSCGAAGALFCDVTTGSSILDEEVKPDSCIGISSYSIVLGLFSYGDGSIRAAVYNGKITRIRYVNYRTVTKFGIATTRYTMVHGLCACDPSLSEGSAPKGRFEYTGTLRCGRILARASGLWGYLLSDSQVAIPLRFQGGKDFSENVAAVKTGEKWGYIDTTGAWSTAPMFDQAASFHDGSAPVILGGKEWFLDDHGKLSR